MFINFDGETREISVILLDLDGTLLNSDKKLTETNVQALCLASENGTEIVPCTGRFFRGMPEAVRELPFVHYALCINGAQVVKKETGETVAQCLLSRDHTLEVMRFLDTLPVIYDCYIGNEGYMSHAHRELIDEFVPDEHYRGMVRNLRKGVPDVKEVVGEHPEGVSKVQLFIKDMALRQELLDSLEERFPFTAVSTSIPNNIEINDKEATKGNALKLLAKHLGVPLSQTMAFGDGLNDRTMIKEAGIGVAMANAHPEIKAIADAVTLGCDEDGVGRMILDNIAIKNER